MDLDLNVQVFIILKGFIDAKDDKGQTWYGTFLGVVSRRDTKYLSVMFSLEESPKSLGWDDILLLHTEEKRLTDRDPSVTHHEEEVCKYLERSMVLNGVAKNHNAKQAEQAISRYCMENLHLKAVSFIDYKDASDEDLQLFEFSKRNAEDAATQCTPSSDTASEDAPPRQAPDDANEKEEIFLRCEPVLDPVNGVAMNELRIGDCVLGKLPEDSIFFKLLAKNIREFDGIVTAQVTGILMNELGTSTVSLNLSDGVSGVMKFPGKVRVKMARRAEEKNASAPRKFKLSDLPLEVVLGIAGTIVAVSTIVLLFYLFNG